MVILSDFLKVEAAYLARYAQKQVLDFGALYFDPDNRLKYLSNFLHIVNNTYQLIDLKNYELIAEKFGFVRFVFNQEVSIPNYLYDSNYDAEKSIYYAASINDLKLNTDRDVNLSIVAGENDPFYSFLYNEDLAFGIEYATLNNRKTKQVLTQHPSNRIFKLMLDEVIIGHIEVFCDAGFAKIDEFYVLEKYQGQGLGSAMLAQTIRRLNDEGIKALTLITTSDNRARRLYERIGFKEIGYHVSMIKKL
jgi:ribosomal protein S18 acetylase RimI-like enzyme